MMNIQKCLFEDYFTSKNATFKIIFFPFLKKQNYVSGFICGFVFPLIVGVVSLCFMLEKCITVSGKKKESVFQSAYVFDIMQHCWQANIAGSFSG